MITINSLNDLESWSARMPKSEASWPFPEKRANSQMPSRRSGHVWTCVRNSNELKERYRMRCGTKKRLEYMQVG
jgi:hypothetical protein